MFKFVVHFNDGIGPFGQGNANAWYSPEDWDYCRWDRPQESTDVGYDGAVCVQDDDGGASQRRSLATPKTTLLMTPGANLTYEMSIWLAGSNPDGATDMFYFSYGPDNYRYQLTQVLPTTAWTGYVPTASLTFTEIDNSTRTVVGGWQLPPTQTWWQRAVATFTPTIDLPSLHLRNVSNNNGSNNYIGVDDWWVRLAVDAPTINLGPEETR